MSILLKSQKWGWIVNKTRDSKLFFFTFATVCGVVPGIIGYFVMHTTNSGNAELEAQLRRKSRPDTVMMGQTNKERLAEFLGELQRKEDTYDRYVAALKGETLTRKPSVRVQPIPKESNTESDKEQKEQSRRGCASTVGMISFCDQDGRARRIHQFERGIYLNFLAYQHNKEI